MKRKLSSCLFALCVLANYSLFAELSAGSVKEEGGKLYINEGNVCITTNGIFLDLDGQFLPISAVGKDEKGTYIPVLLQAYL